MKMISRTLFTGTDGELQARVEAFKAALAAHAKTVGVAAPVEDEWVESLARSGEPFELEPLPAPTTIEDLKSAAQAAIDAGFHEAVARLVDAYPPSERRTWAIQELEARAWQASNHAAPTPNVDLIAAARGVDREILLGRILEKAAQYQANARMLYTLAQTAIVKIATAADESAVAAEKDAAVAALTPASAEVSLSSS